MSPQAPHCHLCFVQFIGIVVFFDQGCARRFDLLLLPVVSADRDDPHRTASISGGAGHAGGSGRCLRAALLLISVLSLHLLFVAAGLDRMGEFLPSLLEIGTVLILVRFQIGERLELLDRFVWSAHALEVLPEVCSERRFFGMLLACLAEGGKDALQISRLANQLEPFLIEVDAVALLLGPLVKEGEEGVGVFFQEGVQEPAVQFALFL